MKAKGCGTLATKILQDSAQKLKYMRDRNQDDDEEYIPDHEDDGDEVEFSSKHQASQTLPLKQQLGLQQQQQKHLPVPHPLQQQVEQAD
ncbi:hypothetical protein RDABS01_036918 [Bienertia sinuspersici]